MIPNPLQIKLQIKNLIVENLMLQFGADQIGDDQALFGPDSLGLDSVDALQLVVALEKNFGLKISDSEVARSVLRNVDSISAAVTDHLAKQSAA